MNWFLRAEGSDLTDEALRDKETMGDDDTVDAPVSPLTTGAPAAAETTADNPRQSEEGAASPQSDRHRDDLCRLS